MTFASFNFSFRWWYIDKNSIKVVRIYECFEIEAKSSEIQDRTDFELLERGAISIKVRFLSFESKLCGIDSRSPLDRALLFSPPFTSLSFFEPTTSIQNVNVEILDRFHRTSCILVTTSFPLIRFNQFGLFFPSLLRNDISGTVSIVAFYKAVIYGMPLIF